MDWGRARRGGWIGAALTAWATALPGMAAENPATNTTNAPLVAQYGYDVVKAYPHDREAFTQGLVWLDGQILESTGLFGRSTLRRVELETGKVLQRVNVPAREFAEGLAVLDGRAIQLTWNSGKGFVYDLGSFKLEREFSYAGEGWGLTTDGRQLILSDGSARLRFLDPKTFQETRSVTVVAAGRPVSRLNELEYVRGEVFANVWHTDHVVRVDPVTGRVTGVIDFAGLLPAAERAGFEDVLNGIAYDAVGDRLFVTGKHWPKLFEVRLKPR